MASIWTKLKQRWNDSQAYVQEQKRLGKYAHLERSQHTDAPPQMTPQERDRIAFCNTGKVFQPGTCMPVDPSDPYGFKKQTRP